MGDPRTPKGDRWVIIIVLCCFGGFLVWMIVEKLVGCAPPPR
jgi:hypothetical protein